MEIILKNGLPHQQKGIEAVADVFTSDGFNPSNLFHENPVLSLSDNLAESINNIQKNNGVPAEFTLKNDVSLPLHLDIKMETGTGKTYVYTGTIYELHKRYKTNKFIIVVPTLPIKAGTKQFLQDPYVLKHFKDVCGYGTEIELHVLESVKKKKGKQFFPTPVREFVSGSMQNQNKIYVLLTNMALLTNTNMLTREDYDYSPMGFYKPVEALKSTHPIVIIDEPHRFSKEQKAYEFITKQIQPQIIIRYGATFPEIAIGTGKNKKSVKDYHNLLYDLNAYDAFNQNLIKGVAKEHFEPLSQKAEKIKIMNIESRTSVRFNHIIQNQPNRTHILKKGDSLSLITPDFENLIIENIGNNFFELSNGLTKYVGEEIITDIYSSSHQEYMLKLAIDRHFETERANFNRQFKIKTLALFFIDDIESYRPRPNSDKESYLKDTFERLLSEKITEVIPTLNPNENFYKKYLENTLANINECHAGYFAEDNSSSDEDIAKEVDEILFDKKRLLSITDENGNFITRRFLFSKWTLKEGWDNPNVFTITKLRSSGSENSKLQEVGRGLRLPVDENGNRISNEEFKLNYIIDFTEADFAEKLIKEINAEIPQGFIISKEKLKEVAVKRGTTENDLFKTLLVKDYIDMDRNIVLENATSFFSEYPEFEKGISTGKIVDKNKEKSRVIKIRKPVYDELKTLWQSINQRYFLFYEKLDNETYFKKEIVNILSDNVFKDVIITSIREEIKAEDDGMMHANDSSGIQYVVKKQVPYNQFLFKINKQTNIPINLLHHCIVEFSKTHQLTNDKFNETSIANFVSKFSDWKTSHLMNRFTYSKASLKPKETVLNYANGEPKTEIVKQGIIGKHFSSGDPIEKYLYDTIAFDSPLERDNILTDVGEIIVFGKIPKNSISIPTIVGQSYSPDFMYVVKKNNGEKILNLVVETKDVSGDNALRSIEHTKIECAKKFFEQLTIDGYKVAFHTQINNQKIKSIIDDLKE